MLGQAEAEWLATLRELPSSTSQLDDLRLTVKFYDIVRRYQQEWDRSAYFREVWLPAIKEAEQMIIEKLPQPCSDDAW